MRLDSRIEALATRQHALVAVFQLYGLGASSREIARLAEGPRYERVAAGVLALCGAPRTAQQALMAAVLDASPGAVLSHTTAAHLWGAPGCRAEPIHVTRHRGLSRRASRLAHVHEVVDLRPHHVRLVDGIPTTAPGRTVFDLARILHPARVERLLDWFWAERLVDGRTLHATLGELGKRGRRGTRAMRALLVDRGPEYVPTATMLERRFAEVVDTPLLPPMRRQVDAGGADWTGRVDFVATGLPLVVEIQSERYHTALVDRAADAARREQLRADGFEVVEVWDHEVWHEPAEVRARVGEAAALQRALRRQSA
jgi:very-short-patch-repair endonuclease